MPRAIDCHIHPPPEGGTRPSPQQEAMLAYFRSGPQPRDYHEMAEYYQRLDIFGLLLHIDAETVTGQPAPRNDYLAQIVREYPKQFIAFASVDPWKGRAALGELERSVKELGLRGLKLHPSIQRFYPNDERFYPLYEKCVELGVPVLLHSGMTGIGANLAGGGGIKFKFCRPIPYVDDIAADFPGLTIIMAHPAFPWVEEQLAIVVHKPNVFMDLSGWSPKYFDPLLVQYANSRIQDKVLFGSDYAAITPERWLADFEAAPFREEVRPKILLENARRLLKLEF